MRNYVQNPCSGVSRGGALARGILSSLIDAQLFQFLYELDVFKGDRGHLADEADYVFGVVGAVGVVDDAGAGAGGDWRYWAMIDLGTHSRALRLPRR